MMEDKPSSDEGPGPTESETEDPRRPFNPISTYMKMIAVIAAGYVVFALQGFPLLIIVMLFFEVALLHDTYYILQNYSYGMARKAAYFNAGQSIVYFAVLAINGITIMQTAVPLILPQIPQLTLLCPLFIAMAVYGSENIKKMYRPTRRE